MLIDEAALVIERENHRLATEAMLLQGAAGSLFSEEGGQAFQDLVNSLTEASDGRA